MSCFQVEWTKQLVAEQQKKTIKIKKDTEKMKAISDAEREKEVQLKTVGWILTIWKEFSNSRISSDLWSNSDVSIFQVEAIRIARAIEIEEGERNKTAIKSQVSNNRTVQLDLIWKLSRTYIYMFFTFSNWI